MPLNSQHQTLGQELAQLLKQTTDMQRHAGIRPSWESMAPIIDAWLKEKNLRAPRKRVMGRDLLFDTFASACGYNVKELTGKASKNIGQALGDILTACPNLTPEEIERRVIKYKRIHGAWGGATPNAIAKYWPELGSGDVRPTAASLVNKAPDNWQDALRETAQQSGLDENSISLLLSDGWAKLGPSIRDAIHKRIAQKNQPQPPKLRDRTESEAGEA